LGQVVPVVVGMLLRRRRPAVAERVHRVSRRVADVLLAVLVLFFLITGVTRLPEVGWATNDQPRPPGGRPPTGRPAATLEVRVARSTGSAAAAAGLLVRGGRGDG
jgi:hypothetical protein